MPPGAVLLATLAVGVVLVVAAAAPPRRPRVLVALALAPVAQAALLASFVFGEDSYRGNGVSRWDAYRSPGGALGPLFVVSVASACACAAVMAAAAASGRRRPFRIAAGAAAVAVLALGVPTVIGFGAS